MNKVTLLEKLESSMATAAVASDGPCMPTGEKKNCRLAMVDCRVAAGPVRDSTVPFNTSDDTTRKMLFFM